MRPTVESAINLMKTILSIQYADVCFDNWEIVINKNNWTKEEKDYALGFVNERRNQVRAAK